MKDAACRDAIPSGEGVVRYLPYLGVTNRDAGLGYVHEGCAEVRDESGADADQRAMRTEYVSRAIRGLEEVIAQASKVAGAGTDDSCIRRCVSMKVFGGGLVLGLLSGAVTATVALLLFYSPTSANVRIVEGVTTVVNQDGTAAGVANERGEGGQSYVIAGAMWRDSSGGWHTSSTPPTCLEPLSSGARVRLGVVDAKPTQNAPGRPMVVWVECLS